MEEPHKPYKMFEEETRGFRNQMECFREPTKVSRTNHNVPQKAIIFLNPPILLWIMIDPKIFNQGQK